MDEKITLLESILGHGHKTNRDYYQFNCPFCNHHKPKLGISIGSGKWKCWVCGVNGSRITLLLNKLQVSPLVLTKIKSLFLETSYTPKKEITNLLTLPKEFIPLWESKNDFFHDKALNYLLSRGVTLLDIFKHRIGYCVYGKYRDMVIFPFYDISGNLVYFTGRSYSPTASYKFASPTGVEKDQVFDEGLVNWNEPIILVESKLDAIVVRRNAIPLNGKQISKSLLKKILEEGVKIIYLCLDGDAVKDIMQYSNWFIQHGIEVRITQFPIDENTSGSLNRTVYHDPTSLGYEEVWRHIDTAKVITESDTFKYSILNKLKK